ncbi:MAG: VWA domain-containing protein [Arcobacter sp.]|uniref:VWA domain-containing protein n=1 Tax=Arcobacter sp. TaxID=1872629 RepID=UPI003AFFDF85
MQFLYPNVLFLMLIPTLILFFLIVTQKSKFEKIFNQKVLNKLTISSSKLTKKSRNILLFISLVFMIIALSRPVSDEKEQNINQELIPIVIAIDASKSMLAQDVYPSRLKMAKKKILDLIKSSKQLSIGIIIFGESSFILSPLTNDFTSLNFLVENFDYNLNISDGSNIFSALEASNKLLKDYKSKNILLLSDGGNANNYQEEIEYANKNNLNIYTITIATNNPTPIPTKDGYVNDKDGNIAMVKLNENIKKLSLNSEAGYTNYTLNNDDINSIINDISKKTQKVNMEVKKQKVYTELFYYPLGFALFILLIAFSSLPSIKSLAKTSVLLIILCNIDVNASILDFNTIKEATKAYNNKEYTTSSNKFKDFISTNEGRYNFANSLYKEKKYESALKMYKDIATSDDELEFKKLHNMGNTYVKLNDLNSAKKMYENALKIKEDKQTKENLELVKKALKNKQNKDSKQKQNDKNNKQDKDTKKDKNDKNKSDNKEQSKKDKENNSNKENNKKSQNNKNNENKDDKKASQRKVNENLLSNKEEKKWLNLLKNQKNPILLKKVETKNNSKNSSSSPW